MKYVVFREWCPEHAEKLYEKTVKQAQLVKEHPEKWPKTLFPLHYYGWCKALTIVEAEPDQVNYSTIYWFPEMKEEYEPLAEASKITELYAQMKK